MVNTRDSKTQRCGFESCTIYQHDLPIGVNMKLKDYSIPDLTDTVVTISQQETFISSIGSKLEDVIDSDYDLILHDNKEVRDLLKEVKKAKTQLFKTLRKYESGISKFKDEIYTELGDRCERLDKCQETT